MAFRNYFKFSGRSQRAEYWWFYLFTLLGGIAAGVLDAVVGVAVLGLIFQLAVLIPTFAVGFCRMHDTGRSGLWIFAPLLGVILVGVGAVAGFELDGEGSGSAVGGVLFVIGILVMLGLSIAVLVFLCLDSDRDSNRFGPSPKYGTDADIFN